MRRSFRDEFGITLTLPLGIERRERARRQRLRRAAVVALLLLGALLLAAGLYRPARAAEVQSASASRSTLESISADSSERDRGARLRSRAM